MAADYEGHVLAQSDYYTTGQQVMIAYVPTHGVRTLYAAIGDLFAWLCMISLVVFIGLAVLQSRRNRSTAAAASLPKPQPVH